jgi:hypothetical protein
MRSGASAATASKGSIVPLGSTSIGATSSGIASTCHGYSPSASAIKGSRAAPASGASSAMSTSVHCRSSDTIRSGCLSRVVVP